MILKGKTAIITGLGRGIVKDISIKLAQEGCNIVLIARTRKQLQKVKNDIVNYKCKALIIPADISKKGEIAKIVKKIMNCFSSIDILINNASVLYSSNFFKITEEQWDKTMNTNLKATFLLSKKY